LSQTVHPIRWHCREYIAESADCSTRLQCLLVVWVCFSFDIHLTRTAKPCGSVAPTTLTLDSLEWPQGLYRRSQQVLCASFDVGLLSCLWFRVSNFNHFSL